MVFVHHKKKYLVTLPSSVLCAKCNLAPNNSVWELSGSACQRTDVNTEHSLTRAASVTVVSIHGTCHPCCFSRLSRVYLMCCASLWIEPAGHCQHGPRRCRWPTLTTVAAAHDSPRVQTWWSLHGFTYTIPRLCVSCVFTHGEGLLATSVSYLKTKRVSAKDTKGIAKRLRVLTLSSVHFI